MESYPCKSRCRRFESCRGHQSFSRSEAVFTTDTRLRCYLADIRFVLPCLLGNDNTTRGTTDDIRNHTPGHPPLPVAEHLIPRDNGYGVHEVAAVTLGEFTGRVWRHVHRDGDGTRFEFDATIDGLVDASSSGLGDNPQRLRQLASVAWATADELGEARTRQRHPAGRGL